MKRYKTEKYLYPDDRPIYGRPFDANPIVFGMHRMTFERPYILSQFKRGTCFFGYPSTRQQLPAEIYRIRIRLYSWRPPWTRLLPT